jgi:hypothetical protein
MHDGIEFTQPGETDDLHTWIVAANAPVMNKKSQTANKG